MIVDIGQGLYLYKGVLEGINEKVISGLKDFHKKNPLKQGIEKEVIKGGIKNISDIPLILLSIAFRRQEGLLLKNSS